MGMRSSARRRLVWGSAIVAVLFVVTASMAGAAAPPKFQLVVTDEVVNGSLHFVVATVPPVAEPGTYKVGLANNSVAPHVLIAVGGLPAGITEAQFIALLDAGAPPPGVFEAGAVFSKQGQDHQKQFDLTTPGQYGYFCPIPSIIDGTPHYKEGFVGHFRVEAP